MKPRVSICIPCFNAERWIAEAVRSALGQTWSETEVIVVDDGSTDGSLEKLAEFGDSILLICGEHRGGNSARNLAFRRASGEWLQFLDADDYLKPAKIERQFEESQEGAAADVIYSPTYDDPMEGAGAALRHSSVDLSADIYAQWIAWEIPQTGGCLWRKSALESLGGWKEGQPCCQEHELYLRALQAGLRFVFAPTPNAVYRIWSEDTVCRKDPRLVIKVRTGLIDNMREWMTARGLWTNQHQRIAGRACFEMARTIAKYDLAEAAAYHRGRMKKGLIHPAGPTAPPKYRLVYYTLGFERAERLAAARR
jgi:glycosyltransferase involved in cell wall biosynthesis